MLATAHRRILVVLMVASGFVNLEPLAGQLRTSGGGRRLVRQVAHQPSDPPQAKAPPEPAGSDRPDAAQVAPEPDPEVIGAPAPEWSEDVVWEENWASNAGCPKWGSVEYLIWR